MNGLAMSDADIMAEAYAEPGSGMAVGSNLPTSASLSGALTSSGMMENGGLGGSPGSRITCRFCGKRFSQSGYVKAHERIHTGEKPFHCSVCGKQFSDPSNWKKHERVHTRQMSEATDKGSILKQTINSTPSLVQPRRLKPEAPSNACKICGKVFSSQSSLATHRRIHTGERPYKCLTCGKAFTQVGTLRTHERVHTGEKPYMCKICGRTFAQCGSYKMHERRHLNMSYRRCRLCHMTFASWPELQDHVATHHQNQYNPSMVYSLTDAQSAEITLANGEYEESRNTPPRTIVLKTEPPQTDFSSHIPLPPFSTADVVKSLGSSAMSLSSNPSVNAFVSQSVSANTFNTMDHPEDLSTHSFQENLQKQENSECQENIPPPQDTLDLVNMVSRDRKFSSESTLGAMSDVNCDNTNFRYEVDNKEEVTHLVHHHHHHHHHSSENSSVCSSKSLDGTADCASSHDESATSAISRLNLNTRMMPSSNSRKQKHPMRRYSSTNGNDHDIPQSASPSEGSAALAVPAVDQRDAEDQAMLSYLLLKGKVYKCEHCRIVFDDCTLYLLHNGFHSHDGDPFRCVICRLVCKDHIDFNCHLTSHIN